MDHGIWISEAEHFYRALAADNSKAWWSQNRSTYDDVIKPGATALLEELRPTIAKMTDGPVETKLFRPFRDVRFSKDKTPYKAHVHMLWRDQSGVAWFFGVGIDYRTVGCGVMTFTSDQLANWRKFIDLDGLRFAPIAEELARHDLNFRAPQLKRVPAPYPADHPLELYLRMKSCVVSGPLPAGVIIEAIADRFRQLWPVGHFLGQVLEA